MAERLQPGRATTSSPAPGSWRQHALGVLAIAVVAFLAAAFAHWFREAMFAIADAISGHKSSYLAARDMHGVIVFLLVAAGLVGSVAIGRLAVRWRGERLGLSAIAAAARNEGPGPSWRATALRSSGTFLASASLASVGRESAIMEMGGSVGSVGDRIVRGSGSALATTGIAAAFAAAYHAPLAAVMYLEEHLGVRHDRRTAAHAVAGAGLGFLVATQVFGADGPLPRAAHPWSWKVLALAAVGLVPAYAASRLFRTLRQWLCDRCANRPRRRWWGIAVMVAVSAAVVAVVPLTAGNGLEAIRHAAVTPTVGVALALVAAKLVATSAAVGVGAPVGVMSPSLAVAAGAVLLTEVLLRNMGVELGTAGTDAMLVVMAVGVAVSVSAPLVAIFMVPEMAGQYSLVPLSAMAVVATWLIDGAVSRRRERMALPMPGERPEVHDVDA